MKDYELTVLFHPDLEMNLDPALDKVKKVLKSNGAKITNEENEGKKRLAYSINGLEYAIFYYINLELPADAPAKISSAFNISDEVMRYLLVRTDPRKAKLAARRQAAGTRESQDSNESEESTITDKKGE
ncbi:30S ribosomal protein S6 [Candidatus Saccharibacteria bacterium]|nr:30S ribosomal protein S6 [Candidatus Saccharibacteria bacterium]